MIIAVMYATFAVGKRKPEKNFRLALDSNLWPLWYRCSALPIIKLTSQRRAGRQAFFSQLQSCVHNCDHHPSFNSSLLSSHIWFSYIHNFRNNIHKVQPVYGNPNSGMREIFACGIQNPAYFCREIRIPWPWNPEYSSRNPESLYRLESNPSTTAKESGIQFFESAIQDCLVEFPYVGREIEYTQARSLS